MGLRKLFERKICEVRPEEVSGQWRKEKVKGVWRRPGERQLREGRRGIGKKRERKYQWCKREDRREKRGRITVILDQRVGQGRIKRPGR